jgi:uncharacterized protein YkwD
MPYRKIQIVALVVVVLVAGATARVGAEDLSRRDRMLRLLNQQRKKHGLAVFRLNRSLSTFAWKHSKRMARRGGLFHTQDLYSAVRAYGPSRWGENVGAARWLRKVLTLWMRSAGHRANVLNRGFRRVGVGVVRARGLVWVTAIFYG